METKINMETPIENNFSIESMEPKRPQFLTVLCVLTFIMCGLSLLGGVWSLVMNTPERMAENIEQMRAVSPEMADQMEEQMILMQEDVYTQIAPYLNFVYILLSFLGAFMMWKLKKKGFYVYLAGELLPYIGLIIGGKQAMAMMGAAGGGMAKTAGLIMMALMFVFDIAFIVMYALNLKHMKDE